jgi:hypothetical protein
LVRADGAGLVKRALQQLRDYFSRSGTPVTKRNSGKASGAKTPACKSSGH